MIIKDCLELTKMRLVSLVLAAAAAGFYLATQNGFAWRTFWIMMFGTALLAAGAMILNEWLERREDSRMARTKNRPIPAGRIGPGQALALGVLLSILGTAILFFLGRKLPAFFGAASLASYLALYTPLKTRTSLCTPVGAIPGALPPLIGWSAASGEAPFNAWVLFFIVFLWQMPHFLSLAWMYRADYEGAGFKMISAGEGGERSVKQQLLLYALALLPVSLLPSFTGLCGNFYFLVALILGFGFIGLVIHASGSLNPRARSLFKLSNLYLTLLLIAMVINKI